MRSLILTMIFVTVVVVLALGAQNATAKPSASEPKRTDAVNLTVQPNQEPGSPVALNQKLLMEDGDEPMQGKGKGKAEPPSEGGEEEIPGPRGINDTCEGAESDDEFNIPRPSSGMKHGSTADDLDHYSLAGNPFCTGYSAFGKDEVFYMDLVAGDIVNLHYIQWAGDASFYILTDCSYDESCVVGADETLTGQWEEIIDFEVPFTGRYYLILDSYGTNTGGEWELTWDISEPIQPIPSWQIAPTVPANFDKFGWSVAIDGETAVVGAPGVTSNPGNACVFRYNSGTDSWNQTQTLTVAGNEGGDFFGAAVDIDGDWIIVGAPYDEIDGYTRGSVHFFKWVVDAYEYVTSRSYLPTFENDTFGISVSIHEEETTDLAYAVVGAPGNDIDYDGDDTGAIFIYGYNGSSWDAGIRRRASDHAYHDKFGTSVSIDAMAPGLVYVIAGSPEHDIIPPGYTDQAGAAYIYYIDQGGSGAWGQHTKMTASDAEAGDHYGAAVCIGGPYCVVGAPLSDDDGFGSGSAYAIQFNQGTWAEQEKFTAYDGSGSAWFGSAVAVDYHYNDEPHIVIGAYYHNFNGAAYTYDYDGNGNWTYEYKLVASNGQADDDFGFSVSVDFPYALCGAPGNDTNGTDTGMAYAFDITWLGPPPVLNDACDSAEQVGNVTNLAFDTSAATFDGSGTCMTSPNIWYCYTATCTGTATISLCGSSYDTMLAIYDGCGCSPLGSELCCNDDACGTQSECGVAVVAGHEYLIEVGGYSDNAGPGLLTISCEPTPPPEGWQSLGGGMNGPVHAVMPWGAYLIAGGSFSQAGGVACSNIAKWDGASWSPLGLGMNNSVYSLSYSDYGATLIAGGEFTQAGGQACTYVAEWDGSSWSPYGTGMNDGVFALDHGHPSYTYAGGKFTQAGGHASNHVALWNYNFFDDWNEIQPPSNPGTNDNVYTITTRLGAMVVGGNFTQAGENSSANYVAVYYSSGWDDLDGGTNDVVRALTCYPDDWDGDLIVGGRFSRAGIVDAMRISRWDGTQWHALGSGMSDGIDDIVYALHVHKDNLIVGGRFTSAGGVSVANIAQWDGSTWSAVGDGFSSEVRTLTSFDGFLIAGGNFLQARGTDVNYIAYWSDGTVHGPPGNDGCSDRFVEQIGEVMNHQFYTTDGTPDGNGTCVEGANVWFCYTPSQTGIATISLCGSGFDTKLAIYDNCFCGPQGDLLCCNDDACGLQSRCELLVEVGREYMIEIGGSGPDDYGYGLLTISNLPLSELDDWADHDVGNCVLTMTDQGILGFMDATQVEGSGFVYPVGGANHLFIGGLWAARDTSYVASRDYDADPEKEWNVSTDPLGYIWKNESGWIGGTSSSDQDIHAIYNDSGGAPPLGLVVEQESWAYAVPDPADDLVIIRYDLRNEGDEELSGLYVGVFLDIDIDDASANTGSTNADRNLIYMTDTSGIHAGLQLLQDASQQPPLANLTLVNNELYVWPDEYVLDPDKYRFLAAEPGYVVTDAPIPNDYSILASAGPFDLAEGESQSVCFAILGGEDLESLRESAIVADLIHRQGITDAPPIEALPDVTRLMPGMPNPFEQSALIRFDLARHANLRLGVFDVSGRLVKSLASGPYPAARYAMTWDGRDDNGRAVAGGIYFLRLQTAETQETRRLIRLK